MERQIAVVVLVLAFSYCLYYFFGIRNYLSTSLLSGKLDSQKTSITGVLMRRCLGVLFLGILPLTAIYLLTDIGPGQLGISVPRGKDYLPWTLIGSAIVILINLFASRSPKNLETYPEIRTPSWPLLLLIVSSFSWISFLIAYETMFRGILLLSFERSYGAATAIVSCVFLYALAHLYKGMRETLAAIPFGIFVSWLTIISYSIIPAVIVHSCTALSNEYFSIYFSRNQSAWKG